MKRWPIVSLLTAASGCTMVSAPPPAAPIDPPPPVETHRPIEVAPEAARPRPVRDFEEVRGLWVVRFTMTSEEAVRSMVEQADEAGFNTLIVQVRGRGDAFYASELEPRAEPVTAPDDFDPLAYVIREAHARGMAVHAWVNTHLVWGPTRLPRSEEHLVNAHPDWLAVPRALGRELASMPATDPRYVQALVEYAADRPGTVEGVYSSPSHPAVKDRVHQVWIDLAERYDLDGIHFDYIRFPSADYDYSIGALERFRTWVRSRVTEERFGEIDARSTTDLFAFVDALPDEWAEFRREQITGLVQRIYADVRPELHPAAAMSVLAHMEHLIEQEKIETDGAAALDSVYRLK